MDELTFSNPSSNFTTSTDKKNSKNLTVAVAVQFLPYAGGDKSARPYLFLRYLGERILNIIRVAVDGVFFKPQKAQKSQNFLTSSFLCLLCFLWFDSIVFEPQMA